MLKTNNTTQVKQFSEFKMGSGLVKKSMLVCAGAVLALTIPHSAIVSESQAGQIVAGCFNVTNLGQQGNGSYKYSIRYFCSTNTRKKVDWANAYDSQCLNWKNGSTYTTSRKRSWRFGKAKPYVRGMKSC